LGHIEEGAGPVLSPATEADLAEAVAGAAGPLRIVGGGTRDVGRPVAGQVLSLAALSGVELYEPGALTLVVRAGTSLADVNRLLAAEGQRLAFEPPDLCGLLGTTGVSTIGGVLAANASGPRRVHAGAARDAALGVRFVDGTGRVVKNGGRVMKNVTGYDLVRLLAGSRGTLGVLTEVALKVLPAPPATAMLRVAGLAPGDAVAAMAAALGSPFEVTGAAHLPGEGAGDGTILRIEGFEESVAYRAGRLADLLRQWGDIAVERDPAWVGDAWARVRDAAPFHGVPGDVWRVSLRASQAAGVLARVAAGCDLRGWFMDWGGGLLWLRMPDGTDLRALAGVFEGHATLVRAGTETRARIAPFPPESPAVAALAQGLRARFDPRGILNPGLMDAA
jgi:glycolate oxidase FAD binding subunit